MAGPAATIFVLDDDPSVRRAVARLLKAAGYDVQTFASAREFLDADHRLDRPACLVLDIQMPGVSGIDLQRELQALNAALPIVFITGHGDIPMSVKAMRAGAVDFLPKPFQDAVLLRALQQALARVVEDRAERTRLEAIRSALARLTPRQRQVLELVVKGLLNKQIAAELGTVEKTIKVHRAQVMRKMEVNSLAELVRVAEKIGIPGSVS